MTERVYEFTAEESGERLDRVVQVRFPDLSRSQIQKLIEEGFVQVDGKFIKAGVRLRGGETVQVRLQEPEPEETSIAPEDDIPLNVIYEDDDIVVIDKPAGLVVHPGVGHSQGTLVGALLARYPEMVDMEDDPLAEGRMGIAHRLDKDTSGLMVVARHIEALRALMDQFRQRTVDKVYLALVEQVPKTGTGRIDAPIGRDPKQRKRMAVIQGGRHAVTEFEVIDEDFREQRALLRLKPLTGRTHQLRVHLAYIGSPIVGDGVYGYRRQRVSLKRQFLHAAELSFDQPTTGERLHFSSELPISLKDLMSKLR